MRPWLLYVVVGAAGALVIAGLLLFGIDVVRASRTGPRWKRRLIGVGLALLGAAGFAAFHSEIRNGIGRGAWTCYAMGGADANTNDFYGGYYQTPPAIVGPAVTGKEKTLDEAKGWQRLAATWREAEEVAGGKRGSYPFNEAGKKKLLADLAQVAPDVNALQKAGLLTEPEAAILLKDWPRLVSGVQAMRPTELKNATCYEPMMWMPARDSMKRLADRLPLLEKVAESGKVRPDVVAMVLPIVEADLKTLGDPKMLATLDERGRRQAEALKTQVVKAVEKVKALVEK